MLCYGLFYKNLDIFECKKKKEYCCIFINMKMSFLESFRIDYYSFLFYVYFIICVCLCMLKVLV